MTAEKLLQEADSFQSELIAHRHWLHTHPETGFDLTETREYVRKALTNLGLQPVNCGKAGLVATIGDGSTGRVFLIRADMDALPIREEADIDFASTNGNMHACGHDMHTTMLLGAAKLLKQHESEIHGTIKLMFQPAEEILSGSKDMIDAGVLTSPAVDAALMIHVTAGTPLPAGTVIVSSPGISAPAADYFTITVHGKSCHGSTPKEGIDALTAAAHILLALEEPLARELSASDEAVLTIGSLHAGTAANVISDLAVLQGTLRTYDESIRAMLKTRIEEIASGIATTFRASAEVTFDSGCPTLVNDEALSVAVTDYTTELLGSQAVLTTAMLGGGRPSRSGGSEDFAYVSHEIPALILILAAGEPDRGYLYSQHHPQVKFDDAVLSKGSAVYAYNAMRWLNENR